MDIIRCSKEFENPRDLLSWVNELTDILKNNENDDNKKFRLIKLKNGFEDFDPENITTNYRDIKMIIEYTDGDFKETVEVQCVLKD